MCTVYEEIHRIGIIPVAKLDKPEEDSVPVAGALLEGGIPLIEVTFRADGGAQLYGGRGDSPDR